MNDQQFTTFIITKSYKTSPEFNSNPKSLLRLINFIKNLPIEQQSLDIMFELLKFYRTPLFITCQPLYQKLAKSKDDLEKYGETLMDIAAYVRSYIQGYDLEELKFFNIAGYSKKKKKIPQKSQPQLQFINYIQSLSKHISKLKTHLTKLNTAQLKLELDVILAEGLNRKLNTLELNYEQYFKNQADRIYKMLQGKIGNGFAMEDRDRDRDRERKGLEGRPEGEGERKVALCCRPFFYDREIIKEPENLVLEYKNYFYPFNEIHIKTLKKTVCGFLNTNGGTIFLGIQQDNVTKKRQIYGMQLSEAQKQNLTFTLRKEVFSCIEPDVISNKNYSICFVPVKQRDPPYYYISGRYLTKVTIGYGLRNQIYSYKHQDKDYFAFRTENQVIHREGRDILNAYRERLKNPLPIPVPVHEGPCTPPQEGRQVIGEKMRKQENYPVFKKQENYPTFKKQDFPSLKSYSNQKQKQNQKQKRKYKQKNAMDFIILKLTQKQLRIEMANKDLHEISTITSSPTNPKILFLKTTSPQTRQKTIQLLSQLQSTNTCQFYETQRGIQVDEDDCQLALACLKEKNLQYVVNKGNKKGKAGIQFKTTDQAVEGFVLLRELKLKAFFQGV